MMRRAIRTLGLAIGVLSGIGCSAAIACTVLSPDIIGKYTGGCKDGLAHGFGKAVGDPTPQGQATYEGNFSFGKKHGFGKWITKDGGGYNGEYKDNKRHGKGKVIFSDGGYIEANYINGSIVGNVVYRLNKDVVYRGPMRNGTWEGVGTVETKYGIYRGQFVEGKQKGMGSWTRKGTCPRISANQRCIMKMAGEFRDNALVDGAILHSDGYKYQGKVSYSSDGRILLGVNQTREARAQRRGGDGPSIEMLGRAFLGISLTEVAESVARDAREGHVSSSGQVSNQGRSSTRSASWGCSADGPHGRYGWSRNEPSRQMAEQVALKHCNENQIARGACYIKSCTQKR